MSPRMKFFVAVVVALAVVGVAAALLRSGANAGKKADPSKPPSPAQVTRPVKESELNVVSLTEDAARRLDVRTTPVERKKVRRQRLFGGEVVVPPGRAVVVSAPVAGTVKLPPGAAAPLPGKPVEQGQAVFALVPLLTAEARTTMAAALVDAEGQVKSADVQLKAADVALKRARQLVADQAGSQRAVDEAQAQYDVAQKTLEAAQARRDVLAKTLQGGEPGAVPPLTVTSPAAGVLRDVRAAAEQMVSAGSPLFEVVDVGRVWVRVPVYAGDAAEAAADQPATVARLGAGGGAGAAWEARPVAAPPSGNPLASTVDLFYELDNAKSTLRPGEKVAVTVPLAGEDENLVVPWSAVTFDVSGGAWVYEAVGPLQYARRRVQVRYVDGGIAVLAAGPAAGKVVVTQGVAELFGREMGFAS